MIYGEEFTAAEIEELVAGEYSPWQVWADDAGI